MTPTEGKQDPPQSGFVKDEVLVKLGSGAMFSELEELLKDYGQLIPTQLRTIDVILIKVPEGQVLRTIEELEKIPGIEYAEPNYLAYAVGTPDDPAWNKQYGLRRIRAPQGWDHDTGSAAVVIAIIDTGVALGHPDLNPKIVSGYDFVNDDSNPSDDNGHGTHVAGIAAASTNNSFGVAGVSWGARIMPIKVLSSSGSGSYANVAAGMVWAVDHGARVLNLSLGGTSPSGVLRDAVNYAYIHGAVTIAATGNNGTGFVLFPARLSHVIAVAATDHSNNHVSFSNYGSQVDLSAPGLSIWSTELGGGFSYRDGTSMSTPFVSGLAAILVGIPRPYSPDLIEYEMESTARDLGTVGRDNFYGYGLIQLDKAITLALQSVQKAPTKTATSLLPYIPLYPTATSTPTLEGSPVPTATENLTPQVFAQGDPTYTDQPAPTPLDSTQTPKTPKTSSQPSIGYLGCGLISLGSALLVILYLLLKRRRQRKGLK
jgi:subtilisin family serine protease